MNNIMGKHVFSGLAGSGMGENDLIKLLDRKIRLCKKCELCEYRFNKNDIKKGYGKLLGWKGGSKPTKYFFVGLNPSYNRFKNLKFAFGGPDFKQGTGVEFINMLKSIDILDESYVTNLVKCSSPDNDITYQQFLSCVRFLKVELMLQKPEIVIALGNKVDSCLNKTDINVRYIYRVVNHPNYVISYKRDKMNEYVENLRRLTSG
jgi:uracil-DNA glycosylase family 4